jgi:branched-chain amino acid transport system substrate-binding protein
MRSYPLYLLAATLCFSACTIEPVRRTYTNDDSSTTEVSPTAKSTTTGAAGNSAGGNNSVSITSANNAENGLSNIDLVKNAQSEYATGNVAGALLNLKKVAPEKLSPASQTEYWNLLGLVQLASRDPHASELSFQNAIIANQNPDYLGYYQYNLASAFADEKKTEEAIHQLNLIDLSKLESTDQKKVTLLKDKLMHGQTGSLLAAAVLTPTPTPAPSATPFKAVYSGPVRKNRIGVLLPLSGKYESFGKKVQRAIELAFQSSPLTKDLEIELVMQDSGDTAASHQEALKKLVETDQVIAVIGPLLSKGVEALPIASDFYQVPVVSIAQVQGTASPHIFSCSISTQDQASKIVNYAMTMRGFKRFAILAPSNKPGEEMARAFWDQVSARGGEIRAYETYEPDLNDFREPVDKTLGLFYKETRLAETKALADKRKEMNITRKTMKTEQYFSLPPIIDFDAVFIADEAKTVGQIIPTFMYRDAKNLPYLGITTWNSTQLISRAGDQAEGATFPVAFNTLNPPSETKRFYDLYNATYDSPPGELDATAYDAASVVLAVLKDRPSTREDFNSKLTTVGNIEGATGMVSIKNQHCSRELALYTVKKGEFETVKETAPAGGSNASDSNHKNSTDTNDSN